MICINHVINTRQVRRACNAFEKIYILRYKVEKARLASSQSNWGCLIEIEIEIEDRSQTLFSLMLIFGIWFVFLLEKGGAPVHLGLSTFLLPTLLYSIY